MDMVNVKINGIAVSVPKGSTILEAARAAGVEIPTLCYLKDINEIGAGDIAAVVGLKNCTTGTTICSPNHPILLESIEFPDPPVSIAVEPKTKADQEKMGIGLAKMAEVVEIPL